MDTATEANTTSPPLVTIREALNVFREHTLRPEEDSKNDLLSSIESVQEKVKDILTKAIPTKWCFYLKITCYKLPDASDTSDTSDTSVYFQLPPNQLLNSTEIHDQIHESSKALQELLDDYVSIKSGWILKQVDEITVKCASFKPLSPTSYIPTPKKLESKRAIVNVRNTDKMCFKWAVLASLHPARKNPNRIAHYKPYEPELNFTGISFPVKGKDISKFERLNNISVNLFGYEEEVFPIRISQRENSKHHVDLLVLKKNKVTHYCWIKNFNRLMGPSVTRHKGKTFFCRYCLQHFTTENILNKHLELCSQHKCQKISMPSDEEIICFKDYKHMVPVPFTIYFDIESLILPPTDDGSRKHEPCAYCFIVVDEENRIYENKIYQYLGPNPVQHFLETLLKKAEELDKVLSLDEERIMTNKDEEMFRQATICQLCENPLGNNKVRDHCHMTGKYRSALHSECNLRYTKIKHIPVISHNLKGYDSHLIMKHVGKFGKNITCIPKTPETYLSFTIYIHRHTGLRFIDSLQFLNGSLENLTDMLKKSNYSFPILKSAIPDQHLWPLLKQKIAFPYEYLDDWNKMTDTHLPPIDEFYSSIRLETVTSEDYEHAQHIWKKFNINNLEEYLKLYLKTDVLLLTEVFQSFRKTCLDNFQLDPSNFFSTPGLTWQAFLKYTKAQIKPLTDVDMHLFVESGIRGGISSVGNIRYAKANDPRSQNFDSSMPSSSILCLDKNNLYGAALSEPMPLKNFRFMTKEEIDNLDISSIPKLSPKGYILEVDLIYLKELHDAHNMYPMAPEKITITEEMLSFSTLNQLAKLNLHRPNKNIKKLVPNLRDKRKYICHYRNLQFYLKHELRLDKVHRVLEFDQDAYISPYIEVNTKKRRDSTSATKRDFYKLCNNALYGKTLENVRNRISIALVNKEKAARRLANSNTFKGYRIFDEDLVAVHSYMKNIILNKPIFIGFTVLEISKLFMYEFLYDVMIPTFGDKINLLLTDTDSFIFHIISNNALLKIKKELASEFDLSNFPPDHFAYSEVNKGVVNKMKIEFPNDIISEVVALRPKMYSILFDESSKEKKTAKGVTRGITKNILKHDMYYNVLKKSSILTNNMTRIQSRAHETSTLTYSKVSLSPFDDKRYYNNPSHEHSLAHFHYKCKK